jgi:hypothetical protein
MVERLDMAENWGGRGREAIYAEAWLLDNQAEVQMVEEVGGMEHTFNYIASI